MPKRRRKLSKAERRALKRKTKAPGRKEVDFYSAERKKKKKREDARAGLTPATDKPPATARGHYSGHAQSPPHTTNGAGDADDSRSHGTRRLQWLLHPITLPEFWKTYWEKKPLLIRRGDTKYYTRECIFGQKDIFKCIGEGKMSYEYDVTVTKCDSKGKRKNYQQGCTGAVKLEDARRLFEDGCSIRLLCPQAHFERTWRLLADLEGPLGDFVSSNAYLTPPGTQGFARHYDDIEAFVLQLEGTKEWRVFAPPEGQELPRTSSPDFAPGDSRLGPEVLRVVLHPGDLLYFPRGFAHCAVVPPDASVASLHITVSTAQANSWSEFFELLLPQMLQAATMQSKELRSSLPSSLKDIAGVVNSDLAERAMAAMNADADDDVGNESEMMTSSQWRRESLDRRAAAREKFLSDAGRLLRGICEHAYFDATADQHIRRRCRARLPPNFPRARVALARGGPDSAASSAASSAADDVSRESDDDAACVAVAGELTPSLLVRLVRHDVLHLCVEADTAVVYHVANNTCRYMEAAEGAVQCMLECAPAVEHLLAAYPSWTAVEDLEQICGLDHREATSAVKQVNRASVKQAPLPLLAALGSLLGCGALERRT